MQLCCYTFLCRWCQWWIY